MWSVKLNVYKTLNWSQLLTLSSLEYYVLKKWYERCWIGVLARKYILIHIAMEPLLSKYLYCSFPILETFCLCGHPLQTCAFSPPLRSLRGDRCVKARTVLFWHIHIKIRAFARLAMHGRIVFFSGLYACTYVCTWTDIHISVCSYLLNGDSYSQKMDLLMFQQRSSVGSGLHHRFFLYSLGRESCWCQLRLTAKEHSVLITFLLLFHFILSYFIFKVETITESLNIRDWKGYRKLI